MRSRRADLQDSGWGLPLGFGAKLARPDGDVIVVVGDGGFAHAWAELENAVRTAIKVTVVVLNNGVLGYQKDAETAKFGRYTTEGISAMWITPRSRMPAAAMAKS